MLGLQGQLIEAEIKLYLIHAWKFLKLIEHCVWWMWVRMGTGSLCWHSSLECYILQKKGSFSAILLEESVLKCHALNYVCILHYVFHVMYYCKYSDTSYSLLTSAEEFFSGLVQQHWIGLYKHDLFRDQIKLKDCFGCPREKCSSSHLGYCSSKRCILILCTVPYFGTFSCMINLKYFRHNWSEECDLISLVLLWWKRVYAATTCV